MKLKVKIAVITSLAALMLPLGLSSNAICQTVPDSAMDKQEQVRVVEREISSLEAQLAKAKQDCINTSRRLEEIEGKILDCYLRIDAAEAELSEAKEGLDEAIRQLYIEGRVDDLVKMLAANDVSEFLVRYDYLMDVTTKKGSDFSLLREKKKKLDSVQDQLIAYKQEAARTARGIDTRAIEEQLALKKKELADLSSQVIAMELPSTRTPAPTDFSAARVYSEPNEKGFVRTGQIFSGYSSWYGDEFHGKPTASGEKFDQFAFTCAHKTLPFGTWLRVTFKGRSVVVKVNDRGPFVKGRSLDLSRGAAEAIGLSGVQWVDCEILTQG